jgi:Autotransporter beta-domain/Calx-beta domain
MHESGLKSVLYGHFEDAFSLLSLAFAVLCILIASATIGNATCTVASKTLTMVPSTNLYPTAGGAPAITLDYTVQYNGIVSNNTGPACTANPVVTVTPNTTPAGGTFSPATCNFTFNIPNPSTGLNHTGTCSLTWTAPAAPAGNYVVRGKADPLPLSTALVITSAQSTPVTLYRVPTVTIANTTNGAEAGPVNGRLTVTQSNTLPTDTTISLGYGGTATNGTDYTGPASVTILAGSTTAIVTLTTVNDVIVEGNETAIVSLIGVTSGSATLGTTTSATNTIADNDTANVTIASSTDGGEPGSAVTVNIIQSAVSGTDTVVSLTYAGTATNLTDYIRPPSVTIPAGSTTATITLPVVDDTIVEGNETVIVNLAVNTSNPAITASGSATKTIVDNDTASLAINNVTISEGGGTATFTVTLTGVTKSTFTVGYATSNGTALAGSDYTAKTGTVAFAANAASPQTRTFTVVILNDTVVEASEAATLTLSGLSNTFNGGLTITGSVGTLTITDNDTAAVTIANTTDGNEAGLVSGVMTVSQSRLSSTPTTVSYTVSGSAISGTDYTALSGSVIIPANTLTTTITIPVLQDSIVEGAETVVVGLVAATSNPAITASGSATNTIADDDFASVTIANTADGAEPSTNGTLTVTQSAVSASDTVIALGYGGTATNATDYTRPASVTIPAGSTTATITLTMVDDALVEGSETVDVTLASVSSGLATLGATLTATNTIADDDAAVVTIVNTTDGAEPATNGVLTVTQSAVSISDTVIALSYGGTATNTTDYTRPASVTIPAGSTTTTITLAVVDDATVEGVETVDVTLASVTSGLATLGTPLTATNTIADNDVAVVTIANTTDGAEPATNGILTVTQSAVSISDTVIALSYGGTAITPADYTRPASVTIPSGSTTATITLTIVDDALVEGSETVDVTLASVTSGLATLGTTLTAPTTIADNDAAAVTIATTNNGAEPGTAGVLTITQSAVSVSDTVIALGYGGTATNAFDYTRPASVTIPAGSTTVTITLTIVDDALVEGSETVDVTLTSVTSGLGTLGTTLTATNTITDNDTAVVTVANVTDGGEPASSGILTVSQSAVSVSDTVLSYSIGGTATSGSDYSALSGTITIPAGLTTGSIAIAVLDDTVVEGPETIVITLTNVTSGLAVLLGAPAATNTISDDDNAIDNIIRTAFESQTHNFMARREDLILSHEPTLHRLVNRGKGDFAQGTNGFNIVGLDGNIEGDFALNGRAVANALRGTLQADDDRSSLLNGWAEGQFALYKDSSGEQNQKGDFFVGYGGVDWRVNDRLLLGLMTQIDWTEDRAANSSDRVHGTGWMVGPYLSSEPFENVFFDLRAMWGQSSNSAIQTVLGSRFEGNFDTDRWLIDAKLAGNYQADKLMLTPEMSLLYMRETQKDYSVGDGARVVAVNGQRVALGRLAAGLKVAYLGEIDDTKIEPFVGGRVVWNFEDPGILNTDGTVASLDALRGEISAGLNITDGSSQFSLETTYDGLGSNGLQAISAKLMFAHQL